MTEESPPGSDAFAAARPDRQRAIDVLTTAAPVVGVVYLGWRVVATLGGTDPMAAGVLLTAEVLALLVFAARVRSARRRPAEFVDAPGAPCPDVVAVVDVGEGSVDELRTTLLALHRVEGLGPVEVVDRRGLRDRAGVATRLGARVHDPSTTVEQAVAAAPGSWVLVVAAGDLPTPDLVAVAATPCASPDAGVVQVGVEEADPTTFEPQLDGRWSLEPFDHQVVRPSLAAAGSVPWYGDGPSLVRRAALEQAGGWADGASTWIVGARLARAGFRVHHLPLTLARTPAPAGFGEGLARRGRDLAGALAAIGSGAHRGLPRAARAAHLVAATPVLVAVQRLLMVTAGVLVLGAGEVPLAASTLTLVAFAALAYVPRWVAHLLLGRGKLSRFSVLRADLRTLGADLFPSASRSPAAAGRLGAAVLAGVVVALDVAVIIAAVSVWREWPGRPPAELTAVALVLAAVFVGVAMEVAIDIVLRGQRRASRRVRLGLVTCRLEEHDGQLVDLSTGGAGVVVPDAVDETPEEGSITTLSFRIPDADGAWRNVSTLVQVAHRGSDDEGGTRLGLRFDDPTAAPLDPVVEFLTIDRRLVALGRARLQATGRYGGGG